MESRHLIQADTNYPGIVSDPDNSLDVMEFFCDTIQGEGVSMGVPAAFLRLQGCTLDCVWCDTEWRKGHRYSFEEIFVLMERFNLVEKLRNGVHLVVTGGSPLKQQERLRKFIKRFGDQYKFIPYIEVENECTLMPDYLFTTYVMQWNNSPKLSGSGMKERARYKTHVLKYLSGRPNSWFKFVVESEEDWKEINEFFLVPELIRLDQIILMPLAGDLQELEKNRKVAVDMAIRYGVRYSTREQLVLNKP